MSKSDVTGREIEAYGKGLVDLNKFSKSEEMLLNVDQVNMLFKPVPEKHKYRRPAKGGGQWTYVTGVYVKKVLNLMFGWDWDFTVENTMIQIEARQCIILGKLTCRVKGREIVKMQFGRSDIKFRKGTEIPLDLGNDLKAATTDALKKCASEFGIAGDIYGGNEFKAVKVKDDSVSDEKGDPISEDVLEEIKMVIDGCGNLGELQKVYKENSGWHNDTVIMKMLEDREKEIKRESNE